LLGVPGAISALEQLVDYEFGLDALLALTDSQLCALGVLSAQPRWELVETLKTAHHVGRASLRSRTAIQTVAVIGTAGGRGGAARLNKFTFDAMCVDAERVISGVLGLDARSVCLVSGGAAWADHVAVRLFLSGKFAGLVLHLPAKWQTTASFYDSGGRMWTDNPGRVENDYHRKFSGALGVNTLHEIEKARLGGAAIFDHYEGFHARNLAVAKAACLVAYSFSDGGAPTEGGTKHTWTHCVGRRVHRPISQLQLRADDVASTQQAASGILLYFCKDKQVAI
jgi:hypothetical protein